MPLTEADLARCPIFQDMTTSERLAVLDLVEYQTCPAESTILREGEQVQLLWVILRGRCRVIKTMKAGTLQELAVLEPGAIFGEMSFFNPAPHSASVVALTEVELLRLTRRHYDRLELISARAAQKIALNTVKTLAERLRKMDEWMCDVIDRPESAGHREEWQEFQKKLYADWVF
jgi:CRP/FNR family transcriptional regulator, cyclic AMP receptor protein